VGRYSSGPKGDGISVAFKSSSRGGMSEKSLAVKEGVLEVANLVDDSVDV